MLEMSRIFFFIAFAAYVLASIAYISGVVGSRMSVQTAASRAAAAGTSTSTDALPFTWWPKWGFYLVSVGTLMHLAGIVTRWIGAGYYPIANMYEFMNFFGWAIMLFFIIIDRQYRVPTLGAFAVPIAVMILGYASVFPREVQPLIPALQSYWLILHVSVVALGEAAFTVAFAAALMYLLRVQNTERFGATGKRVLEFVVYCLVLLGAFVVLGLGFKFAGYKVPLPGGVAYYGLPPFFGPAGWQGTLTEWAGLSLPLFGTPAWMGGVNAAQKWNTLVITVIVGTIVYGVLRALLKQPLREPLGRAVRNIDPDTLDEICYKGIAIGFPVFTLGGLLFAMIWAQKAWGRFWGWDPKETWALITWLTYAAYLHLRIQKGWQGVTSAWMAVIGFVVLMFTLIGVNLLIVGLHSYAVPVM